MRQTAKAVTTKVFVRRGAAASMGICPENPDAGACPGTFSPEAITQQAATSVFVDPGAAGAACNIWLSGDLGDPAFSRQVAAEARPTWVFHLAGRVGAGSWDELLAAHVGSTIGLCEGLLAAGVRPRVVVIGSAAEYGVVPVSELPIGEGRPPCPATRYGASKAAQTAVALSYASSGLEVIVGRAFNIIGPGMSEQLSLGSFVAQIIAAERGTAPPVLQVGNLTHRRDYLDVRDVVAGLVALAERGAPGQVYNLCRGESARMSDLVEMLVSLAHVPIEVRFDPGRQFAVDVADSYGDNRKLAALGWSPRWALRDSLADMLAAARGVGQHGREGL